MAEILSNVITHTAWFRLGLYLFLSTVVLGNVATWLRYSRGWRDGYTRKLNHFGHSAIGLPIIGFLPEEELAYTVGVGAVAVILIYAISAVSSAPLVRGIIRGSIRDRDAPWGRFFFFFPLITGNIAMIACVFFFPVEYVRIAILTVAIADGIAEPVGLKWGSRHQYWVRDFIFRRKNSKSVHGSSSVMVASGLVSLVLLLQLDYSLVVAMGVSFSFAMFVTLIEALSPRGTDNMNIFAGGSAFLTLATSLIQ